VLDDLSSSKVNLISLIYKNNLVENKYLEKKFNKDNRSYYHFNVDDLAFLSIKFSELNPHKVGSVNYWADKIIYNLYKLIDDGFFEFKMLHDNKIIILKFMWMGAPKIDPVYSINYTKRIN
jgi:hypothetical protein